MSPSVYQPRFTLSISNGEKRSMFISKSQYDLSRLPAVATIAGLAILIAAIFLGFIPLGFKPFDSATIAGLLVQLLIISVFTERALEGFINAWRESKKQDLAYQIGTQEQALEELAHSNAEDNKIDEKKKELENLKWEFHQYTFQTMRISLWSSFVFGLLISAVGVRVIEPLISISLADPKLANLQLNAFRMVDILLTGGLISGGSEGIHKIASVYNRFMDSTASRVEK